jgi:hypothetical protein
MLSPGVTGMIFSINCLIGYYPVTIHAWMLPNPLRNQLLTKAVHLLSRKIYPYTV